MAGKSSNIGSGTITVEQITAARENMQTLLTDYRGYQSRVEKATQDAQQNWVGEGRKKFDQQYKMLISKVGDMGDALEEMYNLLLGAEVAYADADNSIGNEIQRSQQ